MKNTTKRVWSILLTICMLFGLLTVPALAEDAVVITKQPEDAAVAFGETATFTVEAEGEDLTYTWYNWWGYPMEDEAFAGVDTNTLKVKATCEMNGITFICEISDGEEYVYTGPVEMKVTGHAEIAGYAFDEKSHMAYCDACDELHTKDAHVYGNDEVCDVCDYTEGGVIHEPIIVQHVGHESAELGEDMIFTVKAYGVGLTYQWYLLDWENDTRTPLADGEKYSGVTTRALTVKGVDCETDDYAYLCVVTNAEGTAESEAACYVYTNTDAVETDAFYHEYVCAECGEFEGTDWHFDTDCDGVCDECEYAFLANAPKLTSQPEDHNGLENGHETLTYKVTATGENLSYQWYADGSPVEDDDVFSGATTDTLTVKSVYDEELGIYDCARYYYGGFSCVVSNENGLVVSRFADYEVEHAGVAEYAYWTEFYHELYCECGDWIEDLPHEDTDGDKVCDGCDFKIEDPFKDVTDPDEWYYDAARYGKVRGFFKGSYGNFNPKSNITRGEMVTVLARIGYTQEYIDAMTDYEFEELLDDLALEYGTTPVEFTDVEGKFYERHARILSALGVVNGYENNKFLGDKPISREELATILVRYLDLFDARGIYFGEAVESFADADKISDWAEENVDAARGMGIFLGDENGCFNPRNNATRAEVAQTMLRMGLYEGMLIDFGY